MITIYRTVCITFGFLLSQAVQAQSSATISKEQFGEKWPLSVEKGIVKCLPIGIGAVVFEANGKVYAINGIANGVAKKRGFHKVDEIWLDSPKYNEWVKDMAAYKNVSEAEAKKILGAPTKVDISPVLDAGLNLCR